MCGIVGYIGSEEAAPILLRGLRKLEYRGYDSAGIAVLGKAGLKVCKSKGRLGALEEKIALETASASGDTARGEAAFEGTMGLGHTRWATHGEPSDVNSHPHTDVSGRIAVVHNGIIENHAKLRVWLKDHGVGFRSETDTEVIAHLIDFHYNGDLLRAVMETVQRLEGSYALGIICESEPGRIIAVRRESPLVAGTAAGSNFIASDVPALLEHTRDVYYLDDRDIAVLFRDHIEFYNGEGQPVSKETARVSWDASEAEKGGYEHFMLKEIHEQPKALIDTLRPRIQNEEGALGNGSAPFRSIDLEEIGFDSSWAPAGRVVIAACGTAWHAGIVGKYAFEHYARIPVEVDVASEFRYRGPVLDPVQPGGDIFIIISQSGETADTLAAMRMAKKEGARIIAVTNVVGSTLAREADLVMYTWAGPEIAVASTKAFTTQLMCLYLMAVRLGFLRGVLDGEACAAVLEAMEKIPPAAEKILCEKENIQRFASRQFNKTKVFYMGRLFDYAVSMESALKLKEVSYIHSEAFAAGELKHGPIALVDQHTLVTAICTQSRLFDKMDSNIKEIKA
ncbi:MAG: glutamine--fructose-6-phosphate transaminase (isomerizing), partial [Treponema sp.]|nr:glutamine--fructose-6-phosphate transaminase (isomerizing) [Treponema sp.]